MRTATGEFRGSLPEPSYFNPRGPCGPRHKGLERLYGPSDFNPRGPCGPRQRWPLLSGRREYISILAVLADRDRIVVCRHNHALYISILAVLADRDGMISNSDFIMMLFQSSRSLRTATGSFLKPKTSEENFNPRGPCGPRLCGGAAGAGHHAISILAVLADRDGRGFLCF